MAFKRRVFISFQNPELLDARRLAVQDRIIQQVEQLGVQPEMFFRAGTAAALAWSLPNAVDIMPRCVGAVVVAFPRWEVANANGESYRLASEYAQIEGAVATTLRLPLLILAERGLVDRGITWTGAGHPILYMPQDATTAWFESDAFRQRFGVWSDQIAKLSTSAPKWEWFGCVGERGRRETGNCPKWASRMPLTGSVCCRTARSQQPASRAVTSPEL